MIKNIKNTTIKLSLMAALALTPSTIFAASGAGFIEGSSESTSAMLEGPNVEQQINRINVGIALIRTNTVLLNEMPVSGDSEWVEELVNVADYKVVLNSAAYKEDPYFSTAPITNALLGRAALPLSPLNAKLYVQLNTIYKNDTNGNNNNSIPDIYALPSLSDMKTFTNFASESAIPGKTVEKIEVLAQQFKLYPNVEEAAIALTPKKYQKQLLNARDDYKKALNTTLDIEGEIKNTEAWLDDDKNSNSPQRGAKQEELEKLKAELSEAEVVFDEKDKAYEKLIEEAAEAIEAFVNDDYIAKKVPLAQKLEKLLDTVDNNAIGAVSMFTAATAHIVKNGVGTLDDELVALGQAKALTSLVGNQKEFIVTRLKRMGTGALMAIPNIGVGTYYAAKQAGEAGKYQTIVDKAIEVGEAAKK